MPNHKSAEKRVRQSKKRAAYNRFYKIKAKRAMKEVRSATSYGDAMEKFKLASKVLDKIAAHGIVHKNYAANHKSSLNKYVNSLQAQAQ
jgi:small subunit ribosomal protein S20